MENRKVGMLIIGIAVVMGLIVLLFNSALKNIVGETCTHGAECGMYDTISTQTWLSLGIVLLIVVIGLFIMFSKPKERIVEKTIIKKVQEKKKKIDLGGLDKKEKEAVALIQSENGTMFQADLMEKLGVGKVGMTRLLDKLEAKQIIERKRRGMNNVVVIKG